MAVDTKSRIILNPENELENILPKRVILNPENENEENEQDEENFPKKRGNDEYNDEYIESEDERELMNAINAGNEAKEHEILNRIERKRKEHLRKWKLKWLRSQKPEQLDSIFSPSTAYGIFGHGEEYNYDRFRDTDKVIVPDNFIVPENCIIIVKATPGERTYFTNVRNNLNKLFAPEKEVIYKDPLNHMSEIINDFGSVRVYKPGDECPNFIYQLHPSITELGLENGVLKHNIATWELDRYGLIELRGLPREIINRSMIFESTSTKFLIENKYSKSVYPTVDDFKEWLGDAYTTSWKETIQTMYDKLGQRMPAPKYIFPANAIATQLELLGYEPKSGKPPKRPGVYYNFICRFRPGSKNVYMYNQTRMKENIRSNLPTFFTAPFPIKKILGNRIFEAEQARKPLLRNTKFNKPAKTRRNRRSRRQRKSRRATR
jgi:hypothetical protein